MTMPRWTPKLGRGHGQARAGRSHGPARGHYGCTEDDHSREDGRGRRTRAGRSYTYRCRRWRWSTTRRTSRPWHRPGGRPTMALSPRPPQEAVRRRVGAGRDAGVGAGAREVDPGCKRSGHRSVVPAEASAPPIRRDNASALRASAARSRDAAAAMQAAMRAAREARRVGGGKGLIGPHTADGGIQTSWREAMANPEHARCRRRVLREFEGIALECLKEMRS